MAKEVHGEVKPNVIPVYKEPESKERISKNPNAFEEADKIKLLGSLCRLE